MLGQLQEAERALIQEVESAALESGGRKGLIEGWYTRSRRDSVIAIVKMVPPEQRALSTREAAQRLRELIGDIPDAEEINVIYTIGDDGPGIAYVLRHRDLDLLRAASQQLQQRLRGYEGVFSVRDSLRGEADEIHMRLLPGAHKLGLDLTQVSRQVRQAYYGEEVGSGCPGRTAM